MRGRLEPASHRCLPHLTMPVRLQAHIYGWLLLLPAVVLLVTFTHYPTVSTLIKSFFSTPRGARPAEFVGMENYKFLLEDEIFWQVLGNNMLFAAGTIPASIAIAIIMAVWVNGKLPGRGLLRMAYFTPTILPMVAAANIWLFFYTPSYGLLDQVRGLFGADSHNWLGDPSTALWCIIVMTVWKEAGFFMIFYLAALQSIPPELSEVAALEGASRWQYFFRVTFPLLMPTTVFVIVNAVINSFKLVDQLFILTKGGPDNASNLLLYYIYQVAFDFWDTAFAATLTVVLLTILVVAAISQFYYLDRRTHYQ